MPFTLSIISAFYMETKAFNTYRQGYIFQMRMIYCTNAMKESKREVGEKGKERERESESDSQIKEDF